MGGCRVKWDNASESPKYENCRCCLSPACFQWPMALHPKNAFSPTASAKTPLSGRNFKQRSRIRRVKAMQALGGGYFGPHRHGVRQHARRQVSLAWESAPGSAPPGTSQVPLPPSSKLTWFLWNFPHQILTVMMRRPSPLWRERSQGQLRAFYESLHGAVSWRPPVLRDCVSVLSDPSWIFNLFPKLSKKL